MDEAKLPAAWGGVVEPEEWYFTVRDGVIRANFIATDGRRESRRLVPEDGGALPIADSGFYVQSFRERPDPPATEQMVFAPAGWTAPEGALPATLLDRKDWIGIWHCGEGPLLSLYMVPKEGAKDVEAPEGFRRLWFRLSVEPAPIRSIALEADDNAPDSHRAYLCPVVQKPDELGAGSAAELPA